MTMSATQVHIKYIKEYAHQDQEQGKRAQKSAKFGNY